MSHNGPPQRLRPVVEALEAKLLYSADMGLAAFIPHADATAVHQAVHQSIMANATPAAVQMQGTEIVFIDAQVPHLDELTHDLQQQAEQGRHIEVVIIQADEDGIARITQTLQARHDISAVHLIAHGEAGAMQLGDTLLDERSLLQRAGEVAQWGAALTQGADLLLYGCDVAAGPDGHTLVDHLAALTGADVAASDDLTGAASLGGNWQLEVQTGAIHAASALSLAEQAQWEGTLALPTPSDKGTAIWTQGSGTIPQQGSWDGVTLGSGSNTGTTASWTIITSAESPTRREAIVVGVDGSGVIRGERWNGTQWQTLSMDPIATGTTVYRQGFAVAYEQQSGNAMLVWNDGSSLSYSVFNGSTWSAAQKVDAYTGAAPQQMQIAAQPKGNGLALVLTDSKDDDYALIWNGSAWGHAITLDTSGVTVADQLATSIAYESQSGRVMVVYGKFVNPNVYYRIFDGSSWSSEAATGSYADAAMAYDLTLASDPNSNRIALGLLSVGSNNSNQVSFAMWSGSAWGTRTIAGSYTDNNPSTTVGVAFESLSGDALAIYGTNSANTRYLTWTSSGGWSSVANGPNTSQPGALKLYSDPYTDHIMLGSQGKNGSVSFTDWTGSAFGTVNTMTSSSGSTVTPAFTWLWSNDMSTNRSNDLLLGTSTTATGLNGINSAGSSEVLSFTDPNLNYGSTTSGTFSHLVDFSAYGAAGMDDIAWVSQDVTLTAGAVLHRGDILFSVTASSTLTSTNGSTVSANNNDIVLFRPTVAGRYDAGTFTLLIQAPSSGLLGLGGSPDIRGLALVERDTVLGDVTLTQGTILYTCGTGTTAANILRFVPSGGLLGGLLTGNISTLITGSDIGINQAISGLELVSTATPMKNTTIPARSLLITLDTADTIGSNNLSVTTSDIALLNVTKSSVNGTAAATASIFFKGSSVGASGKVLDTLAISPDATPVITSNGGGTTASVSTPENTNAVTTVTATDADAGTTLSYSISGGTDASLFKIDAKTGALSFINAPDYENPVDANHDNVYQVTVSASDGTYADTQAISVTVTNVNEAPTITSDGGGTNAAIVLTEGGTSVTQVQATDPDAGDSLSYSVTGTDASQFNINTSTGVLTFKNPTSYTAPTDANGDNVYVIQVTATDQGGLSDTQNMYVRILSNAAPPNNPPVIDSNGGGNTAAINVNEGNTAVTTVHATDSDSTSLIYSISGGADQALFDIDALTGALTFHTAPNASQPQDANQDNIYEVTVAASDGNSQDTQDLSITVLGYNKPPVNTLPATFDTSEDTRLPLAGLSVSDSDAGNGSITVTLTVQHGTLIALNNVSGGLTASQIQYSTDNRQVVFTGSISAINATLAADSGLSYLGDSNYNGTDTLTMVSDDLGQNGVAHTPAQTTDTDTSTITIAAVDDPPLFIGSGGSIGYTENDPATVIDNGIALGDIETSIFHGATVQITGHYASGQDVLGFTAQSGISGSWDASTGTLTLTGDASTAGYQAALRSVTYLNNSDNPDTNTRTVTFTISDGTTPESLHRDITITAINDAPTLTPSGTPLAYTENDPATAVDGGIALADPDATPLNGATIQITGHYVNGQDVLGFTNQSGIIASWDASNGILTLSGNASSADYQAALRSVTYANSSDNPDTANRTVTFTINDGTGDVSAAQTIGLTAVNDAPTLTPSGTPLAYTENDPATAVDGGIALADPDATPLNGATIQITGHYVNGQDVLGFTNQSGIIASWDASNGILTLSGNASSADYQAALRSVTYANSSDNPDTANRTVTFTINDGTGDVSATQTIGITAVNDAPTLTSSGTPLAYTENDPATVIDSGITISDPDATPLSSATVLITGHYVNGQDVLGFTTPSGVTGITASWDASNGILTLSGNASSADYQAALRSVTYANSSDNPDTANRTVTFTINDGTGDVSAAQTIGLTAVNDAPTLTPSGTPLAYTENDPATAVDGGIALADPDATPLNGATIQITGHYVNGQDVLGFTNQSGIIASWDASNGILTLSGNASSADYQAALRSVTYANSSDNPDTANRTVTFTINDGTGDVSATQAIGITAVNDAPTWQRNNLQITQGGTATPDIQVQDIDTADTGLTFTVTTVSGGQFINTSVNQSGITSFSYAAVRAGQIAFVQDGSPNAPSYTLQLSDGTSTVSQAATIAFTPTPPAPVVVAPPSPPTDTVTTPPPAPAPTPAPAPAPAVAAVVAPVTPATPAQAAPAVLSTPAPDTNHLTAPTASVTLTSTTIVLPTEPPRTPISAREASVTVSDSFQFSWLRNLQVNSTTSEELRRNLSALSDQLMEQGTERRHVVASSIALTTGLSVGYVIWLVRGGALVGSMLSAMPAWQMIDPLPVLTRGGANGTPELGGEDDASVEHLFDGDDAPPPPPPMPPSPPDILATAQPEARS